MSRNNLADFSNTNKEQKSLAEIRRDAYTEGFMKGKDEGREEAIDEFAKELKKHIDENGTKAFTDGMQMAVFSKHYIDVIAEQLKEQKND